MPIHDRYAKNCVANWVITAKTHPNSYLPLVFRNLDIKTLPPIPLTCFVLHIQNLPIEHIDLPFDSCLYRIHIGNCPNLKSIGNLPMLTYMLNIEYCPELVSIGVMNEYCETIQIKHCPKLEVLSENLPKRLRYLLMINTSIKIIPPRNGVSDTEPILPVDIHVYAPNEKSLLIPFTINYTQETYMGAWNEWHRLEASKKRVQLRTRTLKRDLVAKAWEPKRVAAWLEAGVELEDM